MGSAQTYTENGSKYQNDIGNIHTYIRKLEKCLLASTYIYIYTGCMYIYIYTGRERERKRDMNYAGNIKINTTKNIGTT